jgi:hypothetical protein
MLVPRLQCVNRTGVAACGGHKGDFAAAGYVCNGPAYGCAAGATWAALVRARVVLYGLIPRDEGLYGNVQHRPETVMLAKAAFIARGVRS